MKNNLVETLAWALVELDSKKPDISSIRVALQNAVNSAAVMGVKQEVNTQQLVRLAAVWS